MQTLLRSGHLDIKDEQCDKKNDGRKILHHIAPRESKGGVLGAKNSIFFKSGQICRVDL